MTPLPDISGHASLVAWRLDQAVHASAWDSGEGAFRVGGRWNVKGSKYVVYCSLDPATAILEVAVHKGFKTLDTVAHVLTSLRLDPTVGPRIYVVNPLDLPNPNWLAPGVPSIGQQQFGDALLDRHEFVLLPSVVSKHSWNLIFDRKRGGKMVAKAFQEAFALDTRLHPPAT
ncbi:RES domain-containing protein [Massilia sp. CCM 9210]|uniref:RES family NAD+ phosphorylase n=1 Tax=Massilia scottii TaxID=3057166 RepID=UPI002796DDA0|nr:RES domain-containing protein [Massilia sp. CCM 9210]MDQ1816242.1 RES domain-containing protein [Massilia sp. CCM 9210]